MMPTSTDINPLTPIPIHHLRWRCNPENLRPILEGIQSETSQKESVLDHLKYFTPPRAHRAIKLSLAMDAPGYHVFVSGPTGSGKTSAIKQLLKSETRPPRLRYDFLYIHNFEDADRPRLCT